MSGVRCECGHKLVQVTAEGIKLRPRGAILIKADGTCTAQCYWCKRDTQLPLKIDNEAFQKAQFEHDNDKPTERFLLKPNKQR